MSALDSLPELTEYDEFYYDLFVKTHGDIPATIAMCGLYRFTPAETLEAIDIITGIKQRTA